MKRLDKHRCVIYLVASAVFFSGCATEYDRALGREELILIDDEAEVRMGRALAEKLERKFGLLADDLVQQRIDRIGQKVVAVCERRDIPYHFKVLKTKDTNAVSLPGGYIYVNKGLIDMADTDDELAYVLGHEVGHVVVKHSVKRLQGALGYGILRILLSRSREARKVGRAADIAFSQLMLGYSRKDELLADRLGARYAQDAGYDPNQAVTFLEKLREVERKRPARPPNYIRTHPAISTRIETVKVEIFGKISFEDYIGSLGEPD